MNAIERIEASIKRGSSHGLHDKEIVCAYKALQARADRFEIQVSELLKLIGGWRQSLRGCLTPPSAVIREIDDDLCSIGLDEHYDIDP